jgi:Protein of unknown function (DUF2630)
MKEQTTDQSVLKHIKGLAAEEHRLFEQESLAEADAAKLKKIQVELDQCWDLLRQRQAKRSAGQDPNQAQVRPANVVENYEQ